MGGSVEGLLDSRPRASRGGDDAAVVTCIAMASSNFIGAAVLDNIRKVTTVKERAGCMYVWSSHIARVWINRVRLPVLLVVSSTGKRNISLSAFVPENLVSRDGFCSPVPRHPARLHTQAESGAYLRDSS